MTSALAFLSRLAVVAIIVVASRTHGKATPFHVGQDWLVERKTVK